MFFGCDFETTGLLAPSAAALETQPYIVQIAIVTLDRDFNQREEWMTLVKPPIHIPAEVSKIHGITDAMVKNAPTFEQCLDQLGKMINGHHWLGQNIAFDQGVLWHELRRLQPDKPFWDPATNNESLDLMDLIIAKWGKRRKLGDVYKEVFGVELAGAHDALADIKATIECYKALRRELCNV